MYIQLSFAAPSPTRLGELTFFRRLTFNGGKIFEHILQLRFLLLKYIFLYFTCKSFDIRVKIDLRNFELIYRPE